MIIIRSDGSLVSPGDTATNVFNGEVWTYKEQAGLPDPHRDPPFVGKVIMTNKDGKDGLFYPNEFSIYYKEE